MQCGGVCEYISNAVKADNKSVGKFTSPYIDCIEERIQVNGKYISRPAFALLCGQVKMPVKTNRTLTDFHSLRYFAP